MSSQDGPANSSRSHQFGHRMSNITSSLAKKIQLKRQTTPPPPKLPSKDFLDNQSGYDDTEMSGAVQPKPPGVDGGGGSSNAVSTTSNNTSRKNGLATPHSPSIMSDSYQQVCLHQSYCCNNGPRYISSVSVLNMLTCYVYYLSPV